MKQINKFTLFVLMIFFLTKQLSGVQFLSGNGTVNNPYIVTTPEQLDAVRDNLTAHFRLGNDIDLTAYLASGGAGNSKWGTEGWEPIGYFYFSLEEGWDPIRRTAFSGSFDGNGFKITGLWINRTTEYVGFFGVSIGTIRNIGIETSPDGINGAGHVGVLVGHISARVGGSPSVTNCYSFGNVASSSEYTGHGLAGGLVGFNEGSITNSFSICNVTGPSIGNNGNGGLVGWNRGPINNSFATGNVNGGRAGGLVGWLEGGSITNSYATGNVNGDREAGGLVAIMSTWQATSSINGCYATGDVSTINGRAGGLMGAVSDGSSISNSYATGKITGSNIVEGLIGQQNGIVTIQNSFYKNVSK